MTPVCILLVDDFVDALEMYAEYLTFRGYRVVTARTGEGAVAAAKATSPAIILMDLRMPGMTGGEALHAIRTDPDMATVPIIALTAHALADERRGAMLDGFTDVIAKPCLPDELATAIQRHLAGEGSA